MFVLVSTRTDFIENWCRVFSKRGGVLCVKSPRDLCELQNPEEIGLIMLDLALPGNNGTTSLKKIRKTFNHAKLLLGGIHFDPNTELNRIAAGAVGCLNASLPPGECEKIIDVILQGGIWLSNASIPLLASKLQSLANQKQQKTKPTVAQKTPNLADSELAKLTRRERQVAELVGNGANNKMIARELLITDRTVKAHLTSIYDKLNISDRLQLALQVSAQTSREERNHAA